MKSALGALLVAIAALGACSSGSSPAEAAVFLIESELEETIGLGELTATCDEPAEGSTLGDTFDCTATTPDGQTIEFVTELEADNGIDVNTTNVVVASSLELVEATAADALAENVGVDLPAENMDCGDQSVVIENGEPMVCTLTDPNTGSLFDAFVTVTDFDTGGINVVVGDEARE